MRRLGTHRHKHESRDGGDAPYEPKHQRLPAKLPGVVGERPGTSLTACDEINPADTSIPGFQPPELGGVSFKPQLEVLCSGCLADSYKDPGSLFSWASPLGEAPDLAAAGQTRSGPVGVQGLTAEAQAEELRAPRRRLRELLAQGPGGAGRRTSGRYWRVLLQQPLAAPSAGRGPAKLGRSSCSADLVLLGAGGAQQLRGLWGEVGGIRCPSPPWNPSIPLSPGDPTLTDPEEAQGDILGAQWVLGPAGELSFFCCPYTRQLQDPGARDGVASRGETPGTSSSCAGGLLRAQQHRAAAAPGPPGREGTRCSAES